MRTRRRRCLFTSPQAGPVVRSTQACVQLIKARFGFANSVQNLLAISHAADCTQQSDERNEIPAARECIRCRGHAHRQQDKGGQTANEKRGPLRCHSDTRSRRRVSLSCCSSTRSSKCMTIVFTMSTMPASPLVPESIFSMCLHVHVRMHPHKDASVRSHVQRKHVHKFSAHTCTYTYTHLHTCPGPHLLCETSQQSAAAHSIQ